MYKPQNKTFYCRYQESGSKDITTINQAIIVCKDSRAERSASSLTQRSQGVTYTQDGT